MKLTDYSTLNCPFCHKPGIAPIGKPEHGVNDINDGGNGKRRVFQVFEHPKCESPDRIFPRWTYDVLEQE